MQNIFLDNWSKGLIATAFKDQMFDVNKLREYKLNLDTNLCGSQNRYIGTPEYHFYPEIVIWTPISLSSLNGRAIGAVVIETTDSLKLPNIEMWRYLSSIPIVFDLVLPENEYDRIRGILSQYPYFSNVIFFTHRFDMVTRKHFFSKK